MCSDRATAPRLGMKVRSWKLEVGTPGEYSRRKKSSLQKEVSVIAYSLLSLAFPWAWLPRLRASNF